MYKRQRAEAKPKKKKDEHNRKRRYYCEFQNVSGRTGRTGTKNTDERQEKTGLHDSEQSGSEAGDCCKQKNADEYSRKNGYNRNRVETCGECGCAGYG